MSNLFGAEYRDQVASSNPQIAANATVNEFDSLTTRISSWALVEHNEDGTHNLRPSGFDFMPVGGITMWGGASAPSGWLLCNGAQVSRTTYQALFNIIGTTYGSGDGSTTYNLPDLRQRFPLGKASSGTGATLGASGGNIDHTHTLSGLTVPGLSIPGLSIPGLSVPGLSYSGTTGSPSASTGSDGSHTHTGTVDPTDGGHTSSLSYTGPGIYSSQVWADFDHQHTFATNSSGAHTHSVSVGGSSYSGTTGGGTTGGGTTGTGTTGTGSVSGTSDTANPPFLVINFIVLAGV